MSQGATGRTGVRHDLSTAAIDLFLTNGYDRTTVDDIAEAAGVARRTFFRHFRSKEDAVFPDHDACLNRVREHLSRTDPTQPPLVAASEAAHLVLSMYADDAQTSVRRYQLVREVEVLRDRELMATSRYQRAFTDYLNRRLPGGKTERLLHELAGTVVVSAHNFVLRQWLREGGKGDAHLRFDTALRTLAGRFPEWLRIQSGLTDPERPDEVMVLMLRPDTPQWRIAREIEAATRKDRK